MFALLTGMFFLGAPITTPEGPPFDDRCAEVCADTACEVLSFAGFSPDSATLAYSLLRCPGAHGEGEPIVTWHVREIAKGKRKLHMKAVQLPGEKFPKWLKDRDFTVTEITGSEEEKNRWTFLLPEGSQVVIEMKTEEKVAWYLEVLRDGKSIFRYRGEFEEIYFGIRPWVYIAPDSQKIAVVLALNAMVRVDSGLAVFSLNP